MRPRLLQVLIASTAMLVAAASPSCTADPEPQPDDPRQILWQRSLDDALQLAAAEHRPLLLAVNMDGESASERIVRELYRDPAFVTLTRRCVCVVSSVFRHSPRDFDDRGRRIPCPRLGEVTCGEHMALEPLMFEQFLSDGERVAPRHALVPPGGEKSWDESLAFDLREIERGLAESLRASEAPAPARRSGDSWAELAARRDQRGRTALETALWQARDAAAIAAALDAVQEHGDAGSIGALRVVAAELPGLSPALRDRLVEVARALHLEAALAAVLREQIHALGEQPTEPPTAVAPDGREAALPVLAVLDGSDTATRSLLLACRAFDGYGDAAAEAVTIAFGGAAAEAIAAGVREHGGAFSLRDALRVAEEVTRAGGELPRPVPDADAMPPRDELVNELEKLDAALRDEPGDPELLARSAKASLDLARRNMETGQPGAQLLLEDAMQMFETALQAQPQRYEWWVESARAAYFLERFASEVAHGRRALKAASGQSGMPALSQATEGDARVVEALRWIGDGAARLLADRSGGDPVVEEGGILDGARALGLAAASPFGTDVDWISFASLCGALGLWREELAILETGALRLPASTALRGRIHDLLWSAGRIDLAPAVADRIASRWPDSPDAVWFTGYARMLAAENDRRCERPDHAIAAYGEAAARFERTAELRPENAEGCRFYQALCWMGRGMAHLLADRRADAADCLVRAVALSPQQLESARDGLDRNALDLVDQSLEWRESGPSPVDPLGLLDRLEDAAGGSAFRAIAIADAELREALRADGRNPEQTMRDTVDAGGKPIRMLMGLPTEEGDRYLRASIEVARRALQYGETPETARTLAQSDTIWAERMLLRGRLDGVRDALAEAAPLLGFDSPAPDAGEAALQELANELRAELGEARPRLRIGR